VKIIRIIVEWVIVIILALVISAVVLDIAGIALFYFWIRGFVAVFLIAIGAVGYMLWKLR